MQATGHNRPRMCQCPDFYWLFPPICRMRVHGDVMSAYTVTSLSRQVFYEWGRRGGGVNFHFLPVWGFLRQTRPWPVALILLVPTFISLVVGHPLLGVVPCWEVVPCWVLSLIGRSSFFMGSPLFGVVQCWGTSIVEGHPLSAVVPCLWSSLIWDRPLLRVIPW